MYGAKKNIELWVLGDPRSEGWAVAICPDGGPRRVLATFADATTAVRYAMKERQRRAEDEGLEIRVVLPEQMPTAA